ncbi:paeninodin family lasso peptide [Bacillus sp. RAR_GA_16]|uniref:paeninodin family lasso peptide n=1 Tax=Bacillus sp. RAR_GA_16 TaxID=2876774 RepID=UPI001CCDDDDA|nr:paeninodin family lasso peptide [Bacillus sp. RAR_GA_16]MCA0172248.1 paeninodin family lasso peptide [Bacillus sp. RAR_GA_16]
MLSNEKQMWKKPVLEILTVDKTMASGAWGEFDEGYNENLPHDGQTGYHHVS